MGKTLHFLNDYESLGHENVLQKLQEYWSEYYRGYGFDTVSEKVREQIRKFTNCPQASTYFVAGGTLTNLLACSAFLRPFESIIAADTAHISNMEAGAIEATGHRIINGTNVNGKLTPATIEKIVRDNQAETKTVPRLVFLANSSETGTVYTEAEIAAISKVCKQYDLILFMDGARLGFAMASDKQDLSLESIAKYCDVFYIGGTKNGAIYGEALVITDPELDRNFIHAQKNRGALLAKTYAVAMQFEALFADENLNEVQDFSETLYMKNAIHANKMGRLLAEAFVDASYELAYPTESNQVFVYLPLSLCEELSDKVSFEISEKLEDKARCRFVTTYRNTEADIEELAKLI